MPLNSLYLSNWSDLITDTEDIDYDALIQSDDEFLVLESLTRVDYDALDY